MAALPKTLNPSIAPVRAFTPRWSCSIMLFRYFDDRSLVRFQRGLSPGISLTACLHAGPQMWSIRWRRRLSRDGRWIPSPGSPLKRWTSHDVQRRRASRVAGVTRASESPAPPMCCLHSFRHRPGCEVEPSARATVVSSFVQIVRLFVRRQLWWGLRQAKPVTAAFVWIDTYKNPAFVVFYCYAKNCPCPSAPSASHRWRD